MTLRARDWGQQKLAQSFSVHFSIASGRSSQCGVQASVYTPIKCRHGQEIKFSRWDVDKYVCACALTTAASSRTS